MGKKHLQDHEIVTDFRDGEDSSHYLLSVAHEETVDPEEAASNPDHHTILIVEDNADVRNFIRTHLKINFNVLEAGDGETGFSLAVTGMPDLVITDVLMPGMDGLELCHKLKNDINTCHIPVILLTALTEISRIRQGFESGSDDYITKPFNPSLLKMKVNSLIDNRERLRKVFSKKFPFEQVNSCLTSCDELFLEKIYAILDKFLADTEFDLDAFSGEIGMSRANLYRKIKSLTNFAPNELLKNYRLKAAVRLLQDHKYSVSEVAYAVGFSTSAYFSNCFKKTYGISPSSYAEDNNLLK
jgi:YesN/AraC family two-component response regulator